MTKVFCTRLLTDEDRNAALRLGLEVVCKSFIRTVPVELQDYQKTLMEEELQQPNQILLFTSKNAVRFAVEKYLQFFQEDFREKWQYYSLSGATKKELLKHINSNQIIASADNADDLIHVIKENLPENKVHFFCSNERRDTLPLFFKKHLIPFREWIIYKTVATPQKIQERFSAYLFFSPSAVDSFFSVNKIESHIPCYAIGGTTASSLKQRITNPVFASPKPVIGQLLKILSDNLKSENGILKK